MSLWSRKPFLAVRVLGRDGQYPSFSIRTPAHVYAASKELVWTACVQEPLPEDWELGESALLVPEEVRLLSAVGLCEFNPWEKPWPVLTNFGSRHIPLDEARANLDDGELFEVARAGAASLGVGSLGPFHRERHEYELGAIGSEDDARSLLTNIDVTDQLLLAGLARLLGAGRLLSSAHEPEEAAIVMFISMGAALEFIRLHLGEQASGTDVPFSSVYEYLRQTFPRGDEIAEYFEDRYDERIIATHPSNRMGEFWAPPLMMSDVYHLRKSLMALYRHILLGEIVP